MSAQIKAVWAAWRAAILLIGFGLLLAVIAAQAIAINGLRFCPLKLFGSEACLVAVKGWKPRAEVAEMALKKVAAAQALAKAQARAARLEKEAAYRDIAERIDDELETRENDALAVAERFIAAGGLRPQADRGACGRAGTGPEDHSAGGGEARSAPPELDAGSGDRGPDLVTVRAEDVRICTVNTLQAEAARKWALRLEAESARDD